MTILCFNIILSLENFKTPGGGLERDEVTLLLVQRLIEEGMTKIASYSIVKSLKILSTLIFELFQVNISELK